MVYDPNAAGWNEGKPWSEEAIRDLVKSIELGDTVAEIAVFLQRSEAKIREKIAELGLAATQPSRD
jgi:hypothetical protein